MARIKKVEPTLVISPLQGFIDFIREKGVVGLAIGLAIGTAASGLVTQIVNAVITPTVSLFLSLFSANGLKGLNFVAKRAADGTPIATYAIGDLIDALIKFLAIAAVIYFVVMGLKLDRLDRKPGESKKEELKKDEPKNEKATNVDRNEAVRDAKKVSKSK